MKLVFENWLDTVSIPDEARVLFEESIMCYKISAYRSAFIMSYIGFQMILKTRMLSSQHIPNGINPAWWQSTCSRLRNDDEWDATIADCVKRNSPDRIFLISGSIVSEYEGYRVTRNKCAHGKSGTIDYYHVDSFWNFIRENYYKFVVNGGKEGLLQEIKNYYDVTLTPSGTDLTPIIDRIKLGILERELNQLISDIYDFSEEKNSSSWSIFCDHNPVIDLWDKLVNASNSQIHEAVVNFVKDIKPESVLYFVGRYPSTAEEFLSDAVFARSLWTGKIDEYDYDSNGVWILLEKLIRGSYVPENEKSIFYRVLFKIVGKYFPVEKIDILKETTYFQDLERVLFRVEDYEYPNGFNHANSYSGPFIYYLKNIGLNQKATSCINKVIGSLSYGPFYDGIRNLAKNNPEFLDKYKRIISENQMNDYSEQLISE